MIAPLRRAHAWLWPLLAVAIAFAFGVALATRPVWDGPSAWPGSALEGSAP